MEKSGRLGNEGQNCPCYGLYCEACENYICCTNIDGLCDKCFEEHGSCPKLSRHPFE